MHRLLHHHSPPREPPAMELQPLIGGEREHSNAHITVSDGEEPLIFNTEAGMRQYIGEYPEAENDQATRLFQYAPGCSPNILTLLLQKFDYGRFSMVPRGLPRSSTQPTGIGDTKCKCEICVTGQFCGYSALEFAISYWQYEGSTPDPENKLEIKGNGKEFTIFGGHRKATFKLVPWSLQLFRFPSRRLEHTNHAFDALVCHEDGPKVELASVPIDYIIRLVEEILVNWDWALYESSNFLNHFAIEVLSVRLETDRSIITHLLGAAQLWHTLTQLVHFQTQIMKPFLTLEPLSHWLDGVQDTSSTVAHLTDAIQLLNARIESFHQLEQNADVLIQRITNLISIDEGYRSRDQNASLNRLSWITFIFLPLVFVASIFGMNVNVLKDNPSWAYYIYFSLPLAVAMGVGYALFAKCAGIIERRRRNLRIGVLEAGVVDNAPMWTSNNNIDTVLSWATATGQMGRPAENRDATTHGEWLLGEEHISLTSAIMRGQVEIAKRLIHKPETILNEIDATGKTALHHAVFHGYDDVVEELLAANAAVDVADQQGHTPLDLAVEAVNESCTSLLLRHHYSATIHDNDVTQVDYEVLRHGLHYAAMFVDLKMVDRLLQSGFPSGRRNRLGRTLLFPALQTRDIDFFQRLLDRIIDITCTDNIGYNLLHVAVEMNYVEGVKLLISRGISIDQKAAVTLRTPLFCVNPVSTIASDTILEALIDAGADMNATDNGGNMFVHHLAKSDAACAPAIELLVNKGADLLCENESHDLPHHLAAASGNLSAIMALKLAPKGFDALNKTATDKLRQRPIEIAASRGFLEVVIEIHKLYPDMILNTTPEGLEVQALLIEVAIRNDDLDRLKNILLYTNGDLKDGQEPFHYAILHNAERIMRYMIEIGCKVEWATSPIGPYSSTVFQLAIEKKCGRTVDILLDMNVSLEGTDSYGWTCLHSAAKVGELSIATRIVAAMNKSSYRGVLVTVRDREGWTAFDIALNQDHKALIDLLKDKTYVKGHYLPPWDSRRTKYFPGCPFSVPADVIEPIEIPVSTATSIPPETRRWLAMVAEQSKHMFTTTKKT